MMVWTKQSTLTWDWSPSITSWFLGRCSEESTKLRLCQMKCLCYRTRHEKESFMRCCRVCFCKMLNRAAWSRRHGAAEINSSTPWRWDGSRPGQETQREGKDLELLSPESLGEQLQIILSVQMFLRWSVSNSSVSKTKQRLGWRSRLKPDQCLRTW